MPGTAPAKVGELFPLARVRSEMLTVSPQYAGPRSTNNTRPTLPASRVAKALPGPVIVTGSVIVSGPLLYKGIVCGVVNTDALNVMTSRTPTFSLANLIASRIDKLLGV